MTTTPRLPGELIALRGFTPFLLDTARSATRIPSIAFLNRLQELGCPSPRRVLTELDGAGFLAPHARGLAVSMAGYRALLFLSGALGAPTPSILDELYSIDTSSRRYELVREGMTTRFIKELLTNPSFQRLYICSPWINLQRQDLSRLAVAIHKAQGIVRRVPEILVVVQTPRRDDLAKSIRDLKQFGATIVEKPRLHSKLYMRKPGPAGGLSMAIVGSENLTRPKWIELGIEIRNDSQILSQLRSYFFDVFGRVGGERSHELP